VGGWTTLEVAATEEVGVEHIRFALECDRDVAEELAASLADGVDAEVSSASKSNLDGSPETVLQIIEVALTAASTVVPLVLAWVSRDRVRKIRVGDVEIENPSTEQVEALWRQYLADRGSDAGFRP
jgi:hypothetical protein